MRIFHFPWSSAVPVSRILGILVIFGYVNVNSSENVTTTRPTQQQIILYGFSERGGKSINGNGNSTDSHAGSAAEYKNENYLTNTRDLEKISPMIRDKRLKSACVQVGLWAIFHGKHFTNIASILYASSDSNDRTCTQNKLNETHYSPYQSIRYIGNSDLTQSGLSLYRGKFFSGEELYFDGNILSLPMSIEFSSYGFTGGDNWTLFSDTRFTGNSICLASKDFHLHGAQRDKTSGDGGNKDGIVYNKIVKNPMTVGSIRKGCFEQNNRTIIFPNGETIVQRTTKPNQPFEEDVDYTMYFKLYSEFEPDELITDAQELRLPTAHTFPSYSFGPQNSPDIHNWTVFSGTEYNGHAKCFYTNEDYFENALNENSTSAKDHVIVMGSIKSGCVDPITLPILEQHQLPKIEVVTVADNPSNSLFFTSFIIGLIIFLLIIIVAIFLIIYFYCSSKRRRRRREREREDMQVYNSRQYL